MASPLTHARKLIARYRDRLLIVHTDNSRPLTYVLNAVGIWQPAPGRSGPDRHHADAETLTHLATGLEDSSHIGRALAMLPVAADIADDPPLTCHERELNAPGAIGVPSGVLELPTGKLLTRKKAAAKLITGSTAADYRPGANTTTEGKAMLGRWIGHLPDHRREWLLDTYAAALWQDNRGIGHPLLGPTRAGKSTLLLPLLVALGPFYAGRGDPESLNKYARKHDISHDADVWFAPKLVVIFSEFEGSISAGKVKQLLDGDIGRSRRLYQQGNPHDRVTATAFLDLNNDRVLDLGNDDSALARRWHPVYFQAIEDYDPAVKRMVRQDPEFAVVFLAEIAARAARFAQAGPEPPAEIALNRERAVKADLAAPAGWIRDNLIEGGEFTRKEVWEAMQTAGVVGEGEKYDRKAQQWLGRQLKQNIPDYDSLDDYQRGSGERVMLGRHVRTSREAAEAAGQDPRTASAADLPY